MRSIPDPFDPRALKNFGPKKQAEAKPDPKAERWQPYKPGIEVNQRGELRTVPKS